MKDLSAVLPDGNSFHFWEKPQNYTQTIYVDQNSESEIQDGSPLHPYKTISQAADLAVPGTHVVIRTGNYRETVSPKRGGSSPDAMITYEAEKGSEVIISASEIVTGLSVWRRNPRARVTPTFVPVISTSGSHDSFAT